MNTTTRPLRLAAAATTVALAATLVGCATAENTSASDRTAAQAANRAAMTPALHQALVRSAADRYVRELEVRARLADRSPHEAADRYVNELLVRARMAAETDD